MERVLTRFIREELNKFGFKKGILGLSGGLDSSVCVALAAKALEPRNVIGLIMPYGNSFSRDAEDAQEFAGTLGIQTRVINISPMVDAYYSDHPVQNRILKGNKMARERMSILYDYSARQKALILGTSNKTELLLGYGTIHGDTACAINPMGDLYKTQVRQLALHMGLPQKILHKTPTAGLWKDQTDEGELGLSYDRIDQILHQLVDERQPLERVISSGFKKEEVERVLRMIKESEFKRKLPPIAKLSERTVGHDFLFPYDWDK